MRKGESQLVVLFCRHYCFFLNFMPWIYTSGKKRKETAKRQWNVILNLQKSVILPTQLLI